MVIGGVEGAGEGGGLEGEELAMIGVVFGGLGEFDEGELRIVLNEV